MTRVTISTSVIVVVIVVPIDVHDAQFFFSVFVTRRFWESGRCVFFGKGGIALPYDYGLSKKSSSHVLPSESEIAFAVNISGSLCYDECVDEVVTAALCLSVFQEHG
jgi:hypothetical protein